jgi:hypothetical protein
LLGLALMPGVAIGAFAALVLYSGAADPPSPFVGDGFLCCSYPDTWTEVGLGTAATMVAVAGSIALFLVGCWLIGLALDTSRPRPRTMVRTSAAWAAFVLVLIAVDIGLRLDDARVAPSCDGFDASRREAAAAFGRDREVALLGLEKCGVLVGKSVGEARSLLGSSTRTFRNQDNRRSGFMQYSLLHATFERDRIVSVRIDDLPPPEFD